MLDRCLILGHVDRPQLHDLVLDYCQTQYTPESYRQAHAKVVEAFRASRPINASGVPIWDSSNIDYQLTRYGEEKQRK